MILRLQKDLDKEASDVKVKYRTPRYQGASRNYP